MDHLDDTELMAHVRGGRGSAHLAVLFDRHHRPLYGFLYRLTGQRPLCEDLVQEVFLRVLRHAGSFRPGAAFRPWLYRIARNVLADHGAQRWHLPLEDQEHLAAQGPSAHTLLEASRDRERLAAALGRLPRDKQELLLLSRDPDFSCADLAGMFGCTAGAVKVRVHRALQELRNHFFEAEAR